MTKIVANNTDDDEIIDEPIPASELYEPMTLDDLPNIEWMPISTFHRYLDGISMRTLRRWAENGDIPASKRGTGRWSVNLKALKEARVNHYRHARAADAAVTGILMFDDESVRFK